MSKLPLSGIRVLDLGQLLPGPFLTMMLADLGADVTKIEKGPYGDMNRRIPPFIHGMSSYFMMLNRNKESLVLDLKSEKGRKTFLRLAKKADILVENFRPGVMKRLGLDYGTLKKLNPRLIYCSITGYGQTSRWKKFAGHDLNYIGLSGVLGPTAYKGQRPAMLPTQLADIVGGSLLPMISILAALEQRRRRKKGIFIDSAMLPGTMILLMMVFGKYLITKEDLYQESDRMTGKYPNYALYETKDRRTMAVAAIEPKFWKQLCRILKKRAFEKWVPETDAPGFPTPSLAKRSDQELRQMKQKLQRIFKTKTQDEWIRLVRSEPDCCCSPVYGFKEAISFVNWLGRKDLIYLKDKKGMSLPQWLFPWGNKDLSRRSHKVPPNPPTLRWTNQDSRV